MFLVDTNILIWILRGKDEYVNWFDLSSQKHKHSISSITVGEIYQYAFPVEFERTETLLNKFDIWDVTKAIAKQSGIYWKLYIKTLHSLSLIDCILAATAHKYDLTVLTLNTKHFPMPDIKVKNPV